MEVLIEFRHLEHTPSIDLAIREKSEKISTLFGDNQGKIEWKCWVEHKEHVSDVLVTHRGKQFFAKTSSDDMYKSIDQVLKKLEHQISKTK